MPNSLGSLASMLTKLVGKTEKAAGATGAKGEALAAAEGQLQKGGPLGDERVLAGLGYNPKDVAQADKNLAETANLARFLQDPDPRLDKDSAQAKAQKGEALKEGADERAAVAKERDRADAQDVRDQLRQEIRREERGEDLRGQALKENKEQQETRESQDAREKERERERDRERGQDDREKHGNPWAQPDPEGDEPEQREHGLYEGDSLGEPVRCRGKLEDGTRCIRKPLEGAQYCREHVHSPGH